jgi:methionyl-tRNA synthetase
VYAIARDSDIQGIVAAYDNFEFSKALEGIWGMISAADKFIVQQAPWKLANQRHDESAPRQLDATLRTAAEALRVVAVLASPVLPESAEKIWRQLGMSGPLESVRFTDLKWDPETGGLAAGQRIGEIAGVFPRLEAKSAIAKMRALEEKVTAEQQVLMGKKAEETPAVEASPKIAIDDFLKADLRVGLVLTAEPVKGSTKLMHMTVDIGESQPRTIVAGIAEAYTAADLVNRKVVIVANLQPRKLRGIESNGMIVAASVNDGKPVLAGFHEDIPVGARLK